MAYKVKIKKMGLENKYPFCFKKNMHLITSVNNFIGLSQEKYLDLSLTLPSFFSNYCPIDLSRITCCSGLDPATARG